MSRELSDFVIFLFAIAKVLLLTSVGVGIAIAVIAERCGFEVVALGVEQVRSESRPLLALKHSGDGQLALSEKSVSSHWATSPSRKVRTA